MASRLRKRKSTTCFIEVSSSDSECEETSVKRSKTTEKNLTTPKTSRKKSVTKKCDNASKKLKSNNQQDESHNLETNLTKANKAFASGLNRKSKSHKDVIIEDYTKANKESSSGLSLQETTSTTTSSWQVNELLALKENIDEKSAKTIINLFEDENTIPFICRYRRDMISHSITSEKLRNIKDTYEDILNLKKRAKTILSQLQKTHHLTNEISRDILSAKTLEELEFLYAPYKPDNKGSLAERAKSLGLDKPAEHILYGKSPPLANLNNYLVQNKSNHDLNTIEKVVEGICHIISHIISKSTNVLEELKRLQKTHDIILRSTKTKSSSALKDKENKNNKKSANDEQKYENYFDFKASIKFIKSHQILAINRGEKFKYLSVKILVPEKLKFDMKHFLEKQFLSNCGIWYTLRADLLQKSFEQCYTKKLEPLLIRQIRSELNEKAKKAAIEVFTVNLKQLLLTSPIKGERVLGIDPGFANGCKLALISETADVIETGIIYPHHKINHHSKSSDDNAAEKLIKMLTKHNCNIIALGNGTGCRETEFWLTKLFENGHLDANKTRYSIVSEQGASIYSCSDIAKKEFPNFSENIISAISIARRLSDPLSEYVKIEPHHIGVGMYQHDIDEKILIKSLNEVISECVSFVGVDINTASLSVLKNIAGLTASKAANIIEYRMKNGTFQTRKDLLKVKNLGPKTFTQCAGFIRIEPGSAGGTIKNLLDSTWVHPESYEIAEKIIKKCEMTKRQIGEKFFIENIKKFVMKHSLEQLEKEFKVPKERISVVLEALQREISQDYRSDLNRKPLFKQGITKMAELKKGITVTGAITNITHFGAFVDIGVEKDALIHSSQMNGIILNIGDRVEAIVLDVDVERKRIQLRLENNL